MDFFQQDSNTLQAQLKMLSHILSEMTNDIFIFLIEVFLDQSGSTCR